MKKREGKMNKLLTLSCVFILLVGCDSFTSDQKKVESGTLQKILNEGVLYWGADVIGGVPYVYEDPKNPGRYIGFEVDLVNKIAKELGVKAKLVIKAWDSLIPELQNDSFDVAINGIENTNEREKIVQYSEPYYVYAQQITVRKENRDIEGLEDFVVKRISRLISSLKVCGMIFSNAMTS